MTLTPKALTEKAAREYLGCTEDRWRMLKRQRLVTPHPLTRSYVVADLDRLIEETNGNETKGRTIHGIEDGPGDGQEGVGIRENRRRSRRRSSCQTRALPPPIDGIPDAA